MRLKLAVFAAVTVIVGGLFVALAVSPPDRRTTGARATPSPHINSSPAVGTAPGPTSAPHPAVAGSQTTAPTPRPTLYAPAKPSIPQPPQATLTLAMPGGSTSYAVILSGPTDACRILSLAKAQGKIKSVTIDSTYRQQYGSDYVSEINGYKDAWQVKVNGISPKGCSLVSVTKGDTVTWMYQ